MSFESWGSGSTVVRNHYGVRTLQEKFGGQKTTSGMTKELSWVFTYDQLPSSTDGAMDTVIPANAFIKNVFIHVIEEFTGGTSYDFGLYDLDGSVIDAGAFDAGVLTADLVQGAWIVGNGTFVATGTGMLDGKLQVDATGTFTAGKMEVLIEYIDPKAITLEE